MTKKTELSEDEKHRLRLAREALERMKEFMQAYAKNFSDQNPSAIETLGHDRVMEYLGLKMTAPLDKERWNYEDILQVCGASFLLAVAFRKGLVDGATDSGAQADASAG